MFININIYENIYIYMKLSIALNISSENIYHEYMNRNWGHEMMIRFVSLYKTINYLNKYVICN